jgi:hypothetical protein
MPAISLIAASALAAAQWNGPPVDHDEYPAAALRDRKSAAVLVDVEFAPDGKVLHCEPIASQGDAELAGQLCPIMQAKQVKPATDASGAPAFGFRRDLVSLYMPGTKQGDEIAKMAPRPEVQLQVASLAGIDAPAIAFSLTIAVDQAGKVTACEHRETPPNAKYADAACGAVKGMEFDKLADAGGKPVAYVRPVLVQMTATGKAGN